MHEERCIAHQRNVKESVFPLASELGFKLSRVNLGICVLSKRDASFSEDLDAMRSGINLLPPKHRLSCQS